MIEFGRAWVLYLLPLPLIAWIALPASPVKRALVLPIGVWQSLSAAAGSGSLGSSRFSKAISVAVIGWLSLLLALAHPQREVSELPLHSGHTLIIAIDLSASMGEAAGDVTRFQVVRNVIEKFILQRQGDRIALIAFAAEAYLVSPFTHDSKAVNKVMTELTVGLPGRQTDLGQPIGLAVNLVRQSGANATTMVIVTDGETNTGVLAATDAAELARQLDMTLHVVGFASSIKPENSLYMQEIAQVTDGVYAEALDPAQLQSVYQRLEQDVMPQRSNTPEPPERLVNDLTWIPLLLALLASSFYVPLLRAEQ